jgi:hypothetical protein
MVALGDVRALGIHDHPAAVVPEAEGIHLPRGRRDPRGTLDGIDGEAGEAERARAA